MAEAALLRATGLGRRFGGLAAVDAVSIDLHVGEIHAVIGTNGAGKSTLVNMLSGELAPTAGSVRFAGHDVTRWAQPRRARRNRVVVVRVDREVLPRQGLQRRDDGGRAAGRVLVQVQPQAGRRRQDPLVFVTHR
jgi:ABC-type sugar transport system ATPase subunit